MSNIKKEKAIIANEKLKAGDPKEVAKLKRQLIKLGIYF